MKQILIRADVGPGIGSGHVMRCVALAQAWKDDGGEVRFLLSASVPSLEERLDSEGIEVDHISCMTGSCQDAEQTLLEAKEIHASWIVLDGYLFSDEYQRSISNTGYPVLVIDDLGHLRHYSADLVLNQNCYADMSFYPNRKPTTRFLLGTDYVLLRKEFSSLAGFKRPIPENAVRILVTFGGSDPENITLTVLAALTKIRSLPLDVIVIVGGINPNSSILREYAESTNFIRIVTNVVDVAGLMSWADCAISAGGSTCWELAFMGVPSILYPIADNQKMIVKCLNDRGIAECLTKQDLADPQLAAEKILGYLMSPDKRSLHAYAMKNLVDGEGAARVIMKMKKDKIRFRVVRNNDSELVYRWINDPDVRAQSFNTQQISREEHLAWFSTALTDRSLMYFIILDISDHPVGQVRCKQDGDQATISILIEPDSRNSGYGTLAICKATDLIFSRTPVTRVNAFIKRGNESSTRAFSRAGYKNMGMIRIKNQDADHLVRVREE